VLLSELAGLRRGEIRALKWGAVDFERGRIEVVDNYVPVDGAKKPKAGSVGTVPTPRISWWCWKNSRRWPATQAEARILCAHGSAADVTINEITIARGYKRALLVSVSRRRK
jgi:integrase